MTIWLLAIIMAPVFIFLAVTRNQRRRSALRSATAELTATAAGLSRRLADGRTEEVAWCEIVEVDVFTARVGPHKSAGGAAVFYGDHERGCIVPLDQVAACGLFDHIHRLPGLDLNVFIHAVTAGDRRAREDLSSTAALLMPKPFQTTTVVWTRTPDQASPASPEPDGTDAASDAAAPRAGPDDPPAAAGER